MRHQKTLRSRLFMLVLAVVVVSGTVCAQQTSVFTYQGKLTDGGTAANGNYDLQFTLWDAAADGTQQPAAAPVTVTRSSVSVASGIFTVQLDFGANAFPGASRFLEISARLSGAGSFTLLAPRQQITSTPYAIRSANAATADTATTATNATNATNATQLGGVAAANYVQTNDARLTDARPPTVGSANYIQNKATGTAQVASFNISGNGTLGGTLTSSGVGVTNFANEVGITINNQNVNADIWTLNSSGGSSSLGAHNFSVSNLLGGVPQPKFTINSSGGIGIGTVTPRAGIKLEVNGDALVTTAAGGLIQFGTPGAETGMSIKSPDNSANVNRADVRFNGATLKLVAGPGTGIPPSTNGIIINTAGIVAIGKDFSVLTDCESGGGVCMSVNSTGIAGSFAGPGGSVDLATSNAAANFSGSVGIGTSTPARTLDVNGRARVGMIPLEASAAGVCFNSAGDLLQCGGSSLRWKTNVRPFLGGLDVIRRLRPINFNWKESGLPDIGLGAEDVAKVAPSLTFVNSKGEAEGVKYERLNIVLINAIKEQQRAIEQLRAQLWQLQQANPRKHRRRGRR